MMVVYLAAAAVGTGALLLRTLSQYQDRDVDVRVEADVNLAVDVQVEAEPLKRFNPRTLWQADSVWYFLFGLGWIGLLSSGLLRWGAVASSVAALLAGLAVMFVRAVQPLESQNQEIHLEEWDSSTS
jgi:hypothetical protein